MAGNKFLMIRDSLVEGVDYCVCVMIGVGQNILPQLLTNILRGRGFRMGEYLGG
jgi:hypothetical protein